MEAIAIGIFIAAMALVVAGTKWLMRPKKRLGPPGSIPKPKYPFPLS